MEHKWNLQLAYKIHEKLFDCDRNRDITHHIAVVTSSLAFLFCSLSNFLKLQPDKSNAALSRVMDKVKNSLIRKYDVPSRKNLGNEIEVCSLI